MDTSGFFHYPTEPELDLPNGLPGFLAERGEDDWSTLLEHTETRRFRPGDAVLTAGERDRALYLLVDGWLKAPSGVVHPIATVGEAAFLDGRPRAVTVRALTDGEVLRLGYDAFEALSARDASLGREILLDVGRILSARLRSAGDTSLGWTG
jgi:CRP/FNR family transcriptional regulator, cyclic AMP receptor protein